MEKGATCIEKFMYAHIKSSFYKHIGVLHFYYLWLV